MDYLIDNQIIQLHSMHETVFRRPVLKKLINLTSEKIPVNISWVLCRAQRPEVSVCEFGWFSPGVCNQNNQQSHICYSAC